MIYAPAKFEVATSNSLGEDAFTLYKKIHYMTCDPDLGNKVKALPSTHYIMWPMHLQSLKLLHQTVKEMHLQENTFFDL